MKNLKLGISPCPNDTFIFGAWIQKKINTKFDIETTLLDVQELNEKLDSKYFDVIKVSAIKALNSLDEYEILPCGAALGIGVGPLLIGTSEDLINEINDIEIAIPGKNTTANFLFDFAFPNFTKKKYLVFNKIENDILENNVNAGVIIHENRFTYKTKGLKLIFDLGKNWELKTGLPLPLGVIMIRKNIKIDIKNTIINEIRNSLKYAWDLYPQLDEYVKCNAQEMNEEVMKMHINLYVNKYTMDLGEVGERSLIKMKEFI